MTTPTKDINKLKMLQRVILSLRINKAVNGVRRGPVNEMITAVE